MSAERRSAAASRTRRGLSWKAWTIDLDEHLDRIHAADVAEPDDHRRRRQQERRPVHPAIDRALPGRARRCCATTPGSSGRPSSRPRRRHPHRARRSRTTERRLTMTTETRRRSRGHADGHRRRDRRCGRRADVRRRRPGDRQGHRHGAARRPRGRGPGGRRRPEGVRGPQGLGDRGPPASAAARWRSSRRSSRTTPRSSPSSRAGTPASRSPSARGEIIGVSLVFDYYAGRRQQDLRPDDPGLEAGAGPDPARADRRRRADRAVELPAADGLVEGRARRWPRGTPRSSSPPATPR